MQNTVISRLMTRTLLIIGFGGGLGSIFRYLTSLWVNKYIPSFFPWGTFVVNILGCLLIGFLLGLFERQQFSQPDLKFLFVTGFCGGYTTFSTFASENMQLMQANNTLTAFLYIGASVFVGLLAVWLGLSLAKI